MEDPLPVERGRGAEGHCGVCGLARQPGIRNTKVKLKQLQQSLVSICYRLGH